MPKVFYTLTGLPNGRHLGGVVMRNNQYSYGYPNAIFLPPMRAPTFTYNNISLYVGDNTNGFNTMTLAVAKRMPFLLMVMQLGL